MPSDPWTPLTLGSLSHLCGLALHILVATLGGLAVSWTYRRCLARQRTDPFATAIVLLTVLVAMVTMVIGDSVARAFSLVGALAIVRFRTNVEDTRDTAFVVFAVVAGMAAGVGNWALLLLGVPIVAALALFLARRNTPAATEGPEIPLLVRIGVADDPTAILDEVLRAHVASRRLARTATARQGAAMELTYWVRLRNPGDAVALPRALNNVKGVQHVELGET
ncbi:MAG: DUF4956 domain-containing protein [Planctomycetes bacterium]|nr:DUF4956 domain-containing protein [Planctomycetota bacterium]